MIGNAGGTRLPETTITVSSDRNSARAAAATDAAPVSLLLTSRVQISAKADTTAEAATATVAHGGAADATAQPRTMTPAATVPAPCTVGFRVASAVALVARVTTANVAKSGHGGTDHLRFTATNRRKRWPVRDRNRPLLKRSMSEERRV